MCSRFTQHGEQLEIRIANQDCHFQFAPSFNLAPSQNAGVIVSRANEFIGCKMRFGFLSPARVAHINARSESVFTTRLFREAIAKRRCLVPASGWYEWQAVGDQKMPWRIVRSGETTIFLAAIYCHAKPSGLGPIDSFAILTREASPELAHIDDRMPVIIPESDLWEWLNPESGRFRTILQNPLVTGFESYRVTPLMTAPNFNGPDCLHPIK